MVFIHFLVLLLLTGCTFNQLDQPPEGSVQVNSREIDLMIGAYQWETGSFFSKETVTVDAASPIQAAANREAENVHSPANAEVSFAHRPEELQVYLWESETKMQLVSEGNQWELPAEAGEYVYEVRGKWLDGEASYTVSLKIEPSDE
ncbi:hypothetical protein [Halobacillus sp. A5]|uniref:hypothetical protein n=1 Tax=Halobacillus sp. A5 TaxID=2880263 RepID=UPI0020A6C1EA|nr:hypothetical protein [Halobacillus sp. A5]MCP3026496.1 hypothetical protein [Halobacillus sp. A5]